MASTLFTVRGNTAPAFEIKLLRNGSPIDLTGASARFIISNKKTKVVTNSGHQTAIISNGTSGIVAYLPQADDFPKANVDYLGEVEVIYDDATKERIYETVSISVRPTSEE